MGMPMAPSPTKPVRMLSIHLHGRTPAGLTIGLSRPACRHWKSVGREPGPRLLRGRSLRIDVRLGYRLGLDRLRCNGRIRVELRHAAAIVLYLFAQLLAVGVGV